MNTQDLTSHGNVPWEVAPVSDIRIGGLAKSVLSLAAAGGMPDTFWHTDSRIEAVCTLLGWTPDQARDWAEDHKRYNIKEDQ